MKKVISLSVTTKMPEVIVKDRIRVGDYDAYELRVTFSDIAAIEGDVRLRFLRSDNEMILTAPVTVEGNMIRHTLTTEQTAKSGSLYCWLQMSDSNLYTPLLIIFRDVEDIPADTPVEDLDHYPDLLVAIDNATAATQAAQLITQTLQDTYVQAEADRDADFLQNETDRGIAALDAESARQAAYDLAEVARQAAYDLSEASRNNAFIQAEEDREQAVVNAVNAAGQATTTANDAAGSANNAALAANNAADTVLQAMMEGDLTGPQGPQGETGAAGISAYQVWLAQGNTGTEADFLASLVGPQGIQGIQGDVGPQGPQGIQGIQGPQGAAGVDGTDGTSAYQAAVAGGYTGTESEFNALFAGLGDISAALDEIVGGGT